MSKQQAALSKFQEKIKKFYKKNKRSFPWRNTNNPYCILVSEIMLQQTQTKRVVQKYNEFLKAFPTAHDLSSAKQSDVLTIWQGLGYNRRALNLKRTAEIVTSEYNNKLPDTEDKLKKLPGIGPYTAGALIAFVYNQPSVFIETNIRRVFIHEFFKNKTDVHDSEIMPFIEKTLDKDFPREWYYALMDYGNYLTRFENANKKSKHYTKQSRFEGSKRQVRSSIVKFLIKNGPSDLKTLKQNIDSKNYDLESIISELEKEKFLSYKNNKVTLL